MSRCCRLRALPARLCWLLQLSGVRMGRRGSCVKCLWGMIGWVAVVPARGQSAHACAPACLLSWFYYFVYLWAGPKRICWSRRSLVWLKLASCKCLHDVLHN